MLDLDFENGLDPAVRAVLTSKLLTDFEFFTRFFFKQITGRKFVRAAHHRLIAEKMKAVARGDIRRLIINIPPRYGKTELCVKMFIAWCMANNPRSKFMHLSYSDSLVKDNSDAIRDILKCPAYQYLFHETVISQKTDSKEKWYTTSGGGLYAVSTGSPITGFGAGDFGDRNYQGTGSDADGFGGAIIIDDPLKPADAISELKRERINNRYNNTIASRVNNPGVTPVIPIMQRLHDHDMAGFLMDGGSGEPWEQLVLPAINEDGTPLWPEKHSIEQLEKMKAAEGIILGSPVYTSDVTPEVAALIDRGALVSYGAGGGMLRHKVCASVTAVRRAGGMHAFDTMNHFFHITEGILVGAAYWNMVYGLAPGDVRKDEEGMANMRNLGENMAWLLERIHAKEQ